MHPGEAKLHLAKLRHVIEQLEDKIDIESVKAYTRGYNKGFSDGFNSQEPQKVVDKP